MTFSGEWGAILVVVLVGFLPTEVWRALAIIAGRKVEAGSELFRWVKAVATALLAAVVGRLILAPAGALADVPLALRLVSVAVAVAVFFACRRSILIGALAGEAVLLGAGWWFTG
ncbi:AzlD domain-containing protein [Xanthobacter sp. DSM 24535]|uniref:AzlD domain-containing protein n=1 Tax=Roseixanthobacter psychrophilus TaxID=3119917 RepID=UPI0037270D41